MDLLQITLLKAVNFPELALEPRAGGERSPNIHRATTVWTTSLSLGFYFCGFRVGSSVYETPYKYIYIYIVLHLVLCGQTAFPVLVLSCFGFDLECPVSIQLSSSHSNGKLRGLKEDETGNLGRVWLLVAKGRQRWCHPFSLLADQWQQEERALED